jgi:spore germination cell wall hydrolase CwlJ-like protein
MKRIIAIAIITISVLFVVVLLVKTKDRQEQVKEVQRQEHQVEQVEMPQVEQVPTVPDEIVLSRIQPMSDEYYECVETLARVIHAENSNEVDGEEASWCVAGEVLERVYDEEFPNTIEGVIYQRGQFECTWNGGLYREEPTDVEWEISAEAMQLYLEGGRILPEGVVYGSEQFQGSRLYKKIGKTYFCYK